MFGMMEAMLSFLRRQIGLRSDAADPAGSLHAKMTEMLSNRLTTTKASYLDTAITTRQAPRGPVSTFGSYSTTSTTYITALEVLGKGKLLGLKVITDGLGAVRVTVDGYVISMGQTPSTATSYPSKEWLFANNDAAIAGWDTAGDPRYAEIEFKTSLKIEIRNISGGADTVYWQYVKE